MNAEYKTRGIGLTFITPGSAFSVQRFLLLPILICLVYLLTLSYFARAHPFGTYSTETDFYHLYAPDAERIAAGQFPENPYQGPGYPAMLALLTTLTGDVFVSGKWLSVFSSAAVGILAFFLFERLFGYWVGVGAELIIFVSDLFPRYAINATTDIFFLMLCAAALVVFTNNKISVHWRVILTAVISSLAYLTRYNGVFLVLVCLFGIIVLDLFDRSLYERLKLTGLFIIIFLIVASPWLYANYKHRGSPFYNTNYINIATEFYKEIAAADANRGTFGAKYGQDATRQLEHVFSSFSDVLLYDPKRMILHYPVNLYESLKRSITTDLVSPWVGWFALIGFVLTLIERPSRPVILLLVSGALYLLLMALNHWETRYYFFMMVIYAGLAVYAVLRLFDLARSRGLLQNRAFVLIPVSLIAVMWFTSFTDARADVRKFMASHPTEVLEACDYLKSINVSGARIVARKPHVAYICRQEWIFFPQVKSLEDLKEWLQIKPVDYIAIGPREISDRPALKTLKDPKNAPVWLKPVWVSQKANYVLYQPQMSDPASP